MKNITILFALFVLLFTACEEIPPVISPIVDFGECPVADASEVAGQQRNVLIEEFTGVRCVNCPAGSEAIENLLSQYGERLVAISIHAGFFSVPYPGSADYRTEDGNQILSFVGEPLGYPTAVVNRKQFPGEDDLQLGLSQWSGYIADELTQPAVVKLAVRSDYNETTRDLTVEISVFIEEDLAAEDVRLSLALTETGIVDRQLTPAGEQADYVHKHVLRDLLTGFAGNTLSEELTAGAQFCKAYQTTLPEEWKAENCHLIAFVNLGGASKEVLQVVEVEVVD